MDYQEKDPLFEELQPVIESMGFSIVDLKSQKMKSSFQVSLVVHNDKGVGVDDCTAIFKTVLPRIEIITDHQDINLEVSSPGVERVLKSANEFEIFVGRKIRCLLGDEWKEGILKKAGTVLSIDFSGDIQDVAVSDIRKAKLCISQEVKH